jgi:CheY-like chemotaxis protein
VDDNRISAQSFAMLLRLSGHEVEMAHDGLEAVQKAETYRPHVILLDIGLPKLNGYDACRAIRAQPWGQSTVLGAVTGWGQEDDRRQAQAAGFDGHVVKPVDRAALMKLLASSPSEAGGGHLP